MSSNTLSIPRVGADVATRRVVRISSLVSLLAFAACGGAAESGNTDQSERLERAGPGGCEGRILFDEGHFNFHTTSTGYGPLAELLGDQGYEVVPTHDRVQPDLLVDSDVFLVVNPAPAPWDSLVQKAQAAQEPVRWRTESHAPAFEDDEVDTLERWVHEGGALLLIVAHSLQAAQARNLGAAFGVEMASVITRDPEHVDPEMPQDGNDAWILYTRDTGGLVDHAVTTDVDSVVVFQGHSLRGPPGSIAFLKLQASAFDTWRSSEDGYAELRTRSASGRAQAVAFEHGRGRVVVFADAAMFTDQVTEIAGREIGIGLAREELGNRRLVLNVVAWLMGGSVLC